MSNPRYLQQLLAEYYSEHTDGWTKAQCKAKLQEQKVVLEEEVPDGRGDVKTEAESTTDG